MNHPLLHHAVSFLCLCGLLAPSAVLAEKTVDYTITREIKRFNENSDQPRVMQFTAGLEIEGLWGPVPEELPALSYLEKSYPADSKSLLSYQPDTGPFLRISGYQVRNQPVTVTVTAPQPEELGTLTSGDGDSYWFVRPIKRRILFHPVLAYDYNLDTIDEKIGLQVDESAGTMRWQPAMYEYQGRVVTLAPVIVEVLVEYACKHGMSVKDNPGASWEKDTSYTFRIGWLTMVPCGDLTGDAIVTCPASFPPVATWKIRNLGDISLSIPDNWFQDLSPEKDQGQWEADSANPETAGAVLIRDRKLEDFLNNMESGGPEDVALNGEKATRYRGKITKKNLDSALYVFDRKDTAGRQVMLGLVAADWQATGGFLDAIANSITFGGEAKQPAIAADLTNTDSGGTLTITSQPAAPQKLDAPDTSGTTAAVEAGPAPTQEKLSPEEQEKLAAELFQKMVDTPEDQYDTFIQLYQQVMDQCPDTEKAEISYWRLSNLYLNAFDPPRFEEMITLLETFLVRYPNSDGVDQVSQRLVNAYERTEKWCEAAAMYAKVVPSPLPDDADDQLLAVTSLYANDLKKCGKNEEALPWFREIVRVAGTRDTLEVRAAKEELGMAESDTSTADSKDRNKEPSQTAGATDTTPADSAQATATAEPAATGSSTPAGESPAVTSTSTAADANQPLLSAQLSRKKNLKDYVGRNEDMKGNGAADSRIRARISAPGKTIVEIHLQSVSGLEAAWDTVPNNDKWLIIATRKQEVLNKPDGTINYQLPDTEMAFDLWVQDNNAIASAKTTFKLQIVMSDGSVTEAEVKDE